jgi:mRNA-degrading endonuclease toxin of MazEF toxin-antitoxin module
LTKYVPDHGDIVSIVSKDDKRRYFLVITASKLNQATDSYMVVGVTEKQKNTNLAVTIDVQGTVMFANAHHIYTMPLNKPEYICDLNLAKLNDVLVKIVTVIGAKTALDQYIK